MLWCVCDRLFRKCWRKRGAVPKTTHHGDGWMGVWSGMAVLCSKLLWCDDSGRVCWGGGEAFSQLTCEGATSALAPVQAHLWRSKKKARHRITDGRLCSDMVCLRRHGVKCGLGHWGIVYVVWSLLATPPPNFETEPNIHFQHQTNTHQCCLHSIVVDVLQVREGAGWQSATPSTLLFDRQCWRHWLAPAFTSQTHRR